MIVPAVSGSGAGSRRCGVSSWSTNQRYEQTAYSSSVPAPNSSRRPSSARTSGRRAGPGNARLDARPDGRPGRARARGRPGRRRGSKTTRSRPWTRFSALRGLLGRRGQQVEDVVQERRARAARPSSSELRHRDKGGRSGRRDAGVEQVALLESGSRRAERREASAAGARPPAADRRVVPGTRPPGGRPRTDGRRGARGRGRGSGPNPPLGGPAPQRNLELLEQPRAPRGCGAAQPGIARRRRRAASAAAGGAQLDRRRAGLAARGLPAVRALRLACAVPDGRRPPRPAREPRADRAIGAVRASKVAPLPLRERLRRAAHVAAASGAPASRRARGGRRRSAQERQHVRRGRAGRRARRSATSQRPIAVERSGTVASTATGIPKPSRTSRERAVALGLAEDDGDVVGARRRRAGARPRRRSAPPPHARPPPDSARPSSGSSLGSGARTGAARARSVALAV